MLGILEFRRGGLLGLLRFAARLAGALVMRRRVDVPELLRQLHIQGLFAAPLAVLGGLLLGLGAGYGLPGLPGSGAVASELAVATVRQVAPLVAALFLVVRASPRVAAELGLFGPDWNEGFGAIADSALSRVLACSMSAVALWAMFCAVAVLAATAAVSDSLGLHPDLFLHRLAVDIRPATVGLGALRSAAFGGLIGIAACWEGLRVRAHEQLPQACSAAVTNGLIGCLLLEACTGLPLRAGLALG